MISVRTPPNRRSSGLVRHAEVGRAAVAPGGADDPGDRARQDGPRPADLEDVGRSLVEDEHLDGARSSRKQRGDEPVNGRGAVRERGQPELWTAHRPGKREVVEPRGYRIDRLERLAGVVESIRSERRDWKRGRGGARGGLGLLSRDHAQVLGSLSVERHHQLLLIGIDVIEPDGEAGLVDLEPGACARTLADDDDAAAVLCRQRQVDRPRPAACEDQTRERGRSHGPEYSSRPTRETSATSPAV